MNWQAYRLTFQLHSPLHIGYHDVGNLLRTRSYVPARTVWGALIAQLTCLQGPQSHAAFRERVNSSVRFSYFYPALEREKPEAAFYPCFDSESQQIRFGALNETMTQEAFEGLFLTSYASTALNPFQSSAEDGSLHEVECLSPVVREDKQSKPVFLIGYLFLKPEHDDLRQQIEQVLNRMQLGGERTYGFGKVTGTLVPVQTGEHLFGLYEFDVSESSSPQIRAKQDSALSPLLAHACTDKLPQASGDIEPVVGRAWNHTTQTYALSAIGREWNETTKKFDVEHSILCWTPGTVISEKKTFEITKQGIWKVR